MGGHIASLQAAGTASCGQLLPQVGDWEMCTGFSPCADQTLSGSFPSLFLPLK